MTQYQNVNQFSQTPVKGQVTEIPNPSTIPCQIYGSSASTFYAGTAVRLVDGAAKTILVDKCAATDPVFGFVVWNPKKQGLTAGMNVEVALPGSVMYMETSEAIARGQAVEQVATGDKVAAYAGTNTQCGIALDKATATGQIIRVQIRTVAMYSSSSSSSSCRSSSSSSSSSASA